MSIFKELRKIFTKSTVEFIEAKHLYEDFYLVKLKPQPEITWHAGEHGRFSFPEKMNGRNWRMFSIASAPEEGAIFIGTRIGTKASDFKQRLLSMKKGETFMMNGPMGFFNVRDAVTPMILIATGLGITPVRAILTSIKEQTSRPVTVIHTSSDYHLFHDELTEFSNSNEMITLHHVNSSDEAKTIIDKSALKHGNNAFYYISGSSSNVKAIQSQLRELGIKRSRIINDIFLGY